MKRSIPKAATHHPYLKGPTFLVILDEAVLVQHGGSGVNEVCSPLLQERVRLHLILQGGERKRGGNEEDKGPQLERGKISAYRNPNHSTYCKLATGHVTTNNKNVVQKIMKVGMTG